MKSGGKCQNYLEGEGHKMLCQSSISNFKSTNAPAKQYCMKQSGWGSMSRIKCHLCRQWQWTVTLICNDWRQQQELLSLAQQCVLSLVHHWLLSLAQQSLLSLAQQALLSLAQQALPNWPKIYKLAAWAWIKNFHQDQNLKQNSSTFGFDAVVLCMCYCSSYLPSLKGLWNKLST